MILITLITLLNPVHAGARAHMLVLAAEIAAEVKAHFARVNVDYEAEAAEKVMHRCSLLAFCLPFFNALVVRAPGLRGRCVCVCWRAEGPQGRRREAQEGGRRPQEGALSQLVADSGCCRLRGLLLSSPVERGHTTDETTTFRRIGYQTRAD